jgi:hypothetical protein
LQRRKIESERATQKENPMRHVPRLLTLAAGLGLLVAAGAAQQPEEKPPPAKAAPRRGPANGPTADTLVARMMAFDKNKDGKLTRDEVTDGRLLRLFDRADADKDGVVTKEELTALAARMAADEPQGGGRRGGFGPPGGPGGFGPPGGRGGRGFGGPPQPGQILPPFLQDRLNLTAEQKEQLEGLQKEIDGKLAKILTEEQKKQLKEMREGFRRGGPGGPPGGEGGRRGRPD